MLRFASGISGIQQAEGTTTSSNVSRTHQYLQAVASMGSFENAADFYSPDVLIRDAVRAHVARKQNWTTCCNRMSLTRRTSPGIIRAIQVNLAREVLCQSERVLFCSSKLVYCLAPPHLFGPSNR